MHRFHAALPGDLLRAGACDALGEDGAVRADELDRRARLEAALAANDPHTEQARAFVDERLPRPLVHVEPPGDGLPETEPELERRRAAIVGGEASPASLTGKDRAEHLVTGASGDHRRDAGCARHLRGEHLAPHAPASEL